MCETLHIRLHISLLIGKRIFARTCIHLNWLALRRGDMAYDRSFCCDTFWHLRGCANAVAEVSQGGRTTAVCGSAARGEKMPVLCREFDISRKTGYKVFTRYQSCGLEGLKDRSPRPGYQRQCYGTISKLTSTVRPLPSSVVPRRTTRWMPETVWGAWYMWSISSSFTSEGPYLRMLDLM